MKTRIIFITVFILLVHRVGISDGICNFWYLENRAYFQPLVANPRSTTLKATFTSINNYQYAPPRRNNKNGRRVSWDISVGKEIPLFGWETVSGVGEFTSCEDKMNGGFGFWFPISFHMLEDLSDSTNSIINTDYRFGVMLKGRMAYSFNSSVVSWLDSTLVMERHSYFAARFLIMHESSHLGDELSLYASAHSDSDDPFIRVNVSQEFWEFALSWEVKGWLLDNDHNMLRGSISGLVNPQNGFYDHKLLETNGIEIVKSKSHFQWDRSWEYRSGYPIWNSNWNPYLSIMNMTRVVYDFDRENEDTKEEHDHNTWNFIVGVYNSKSAEGGRFGRTELHLRYYTGLNPNGQFRNMDNTNFNLFGIGLNVYL